VVFLFFKACQVSDACIMSEAEHRKMGENP